MGRAEYFDSFKRNADGFICSILPGTSHPQVQYSPGGLIFKAGGSNMQHVTSLSFLILAYSNYLSHANKAVPCGDTTATPALLKHLAKRQENKRKKEDNGGRGREFWWKAILQKQGPKKCSFWQV
ncbi:hypothetical protein K1719_031338 [Acacia pycnantha]|nr:hypothetical protein K1719_031338 [Acacia pycnantha]